jgi:hypothetical protein
LSGWQAEVHSLFGKRKEVQRRVRQRLVDALPPPNPFKAKKVNRARRAFLIENVLESQLF